jgi:hypothetical protein
MTREQALHLAAPTSRSAIARQRAVVSPEQTQEALPHGRQLMLSAQTMIGLKHLALLDFGKPLIFPIGRRNRLARRNAGQQLSR